MAHTLPIEAPETPDDGPELDGIPLQLWERDCKTCLHPFVKRGGGPCFSCGEYDDGSSSHWEYDGVSASIGGEG